MNFKRTLISLASAGAVAAMAFLGTGAFFSDEEKSVGNTFQAGALDLKVDSEAHYNGMICTPVVDPGVGPTHTWQPGPQFGNPPVVPADHYPQPGMPCVGTWTETDLGLTHQFFNLTDVKPGDEGENTISLHVYNNDAWGRFLIRNVGDHDNDCTEPETKSNDPECSLVAPGTDLGDNNEGELGQNMTFYAWLDQGAKPGFQNIQPVEEGEGYRDTNDDPTEGDNIWQCTDGEEQLTVEEYLEAMQSPSLLQELLTTCDEPLVILPGGVEGDETHNIWPAMASIYTAYCSEAPATGNNNYEYCHGIAQDGRMVGSTTYYFALAWFVNPDAGNEAQTDSLIADLVFDVEQHRNNPNPFGP
jgi:predicted ribosomally synthesized peptide with SipW-like signal peptide